MLPPNAPNAVSAHLSDNETALKQIFAGDDTAVYRFLTSQRDSRVSCLLFSLDGMVNTQLINDSVITPITYADCAGERPFDAIMSKILCNNENKTANTYDEAVNAALYGDCILFVEGSEQALIINAKGWQTRSVSEPDNEKSLRGPREGFTEGMLTNLSLIRRKIQIPGLKFQFRTFGKLTRTRACVCYVEGVADERVVAEFQRRLDSVHRDDVLDANVLEELIKDHRRSPFKTTGTTEKPDIAASKLLEGRVALVIDGTPIVMTAPYYFVESFQSSDDYYLNYYYASLGRLLRIAGFLLTISIPAVYMALAAFHLEMIPTTLLMSVSDAVRGTPFPTVVECVGMLMVFEILRETGLRTSSKVGQALSIVGALVVGQAAVTAKMASAPTVIVVALCSICGLVVPQLKVPSLLIRLAAVLAASALGFYGYFFVMLITLIHLSGMQTMGLPYTQGLFALRKSKAKDIFIRLPYENKG